MRLILLVFILLGAQPASAQVDASPVKGISFGTQGRLAFPSRSVGTPELLAAVRTYVRQTHPTDTPAWRALGYWGGAKEARVLMDATQRGFSEVGPPWKRGTRGSVEALDALGWLVGFNPTESASALRFLIQCSAHTWWATHSWVNTRSGARILARICADSLTLSPLDEAGARLAEINHDESLGRVAQGDAYDQYQRWTRRRQNGMRATLLEPSVDMGTVVMP